MVFAFAQAMLFVVFAREFLDLKKNIILRFIWQQIFIYFGIYVFLFLMLFYSHYFMIENVRLFVVFPNLVATPIILTTLLFALIRDIKMGWR